MGSSDSVFDCDVHIHEYPPDLAAYIEQPWRRVLEGSPGSERWLDTPGYSPLTTLDPLLGDFPEESSHRVTSPDQLCQDMARRGIAGSLIFTGQWLTIAGTQDEPYATAVMQAHNRYLAERWLDPARGIYGAIMAIPQNPEAAAAEIERWAGHSGFAAVWLPNGNMWPLWGHRDYDPIMAAAAASGLPVVIHGHTVVGTLFPYQLNNYDTALAKEALAQPLSAVSTLVNIATTGVLARYPTLKVIYPEAGISWLPWVMWRLDQRYAMLRSEVPFLTERPSDSIRRCVYVTTHKLETPDDPASLRAMIDAIGGIGRLLFASDWPHYDADTPATLDQLGLTPVERQQVLGGNARALLAGLR